MPEARRYRPIYCKRSAARPNRMADRASSAKRGYGRRWRKYTKRFKEENPLCCGHAKDQAGKPVHADRCLRLTQHVDHIVPVDGPDDPLFWEPSNHQGLSHQCHTAKTNREMNTAFKPKGRT